MDKRQYEQSSLTVLRMHGKVKTIKETTFSIDVYDKQESLVVAHDEYDDFLLQNEGSKEDLYQMIASGVFKKSTIFGDELTNNNWMLFFDKQGNRIRKNYYNNDDSIVKKITFDFDTLNNLVSQRQKSNIEYENYHIQWLLDENDNEIKETYSINDDVIYDKITLYNRDGYKSRVEYKYYSKDSINTQKETLKYKYEYNNVGLLVKEKKLSRNNFVKSSKEYLYKSNGVLLKESKYNSNEKLNSVKKFAQNNKGHTVIFRDKISNESYKNKYDNSGNLIAIRHNTLSFKSKKTNFKYVFDKFNNWTCKIEFVNNIPQSITERQISYY
ncbi:MAG: hypothetical protein V3V14_05720 [Saprospiraceae bacterium]